MSSVKYIDVSKDLDKEGLIYDENVAIQRVHTLLTTEPGDLIDLPEYGTPLREFLYEGISENNLTLIQMAVERSIHTWLTGEVRVDSIEVRPSYDTNEILVELGLFLLEWDKEVRYVETIK